MYRNRSNYWSCSKFAEWVLPGKPAAATMEEWDSWRASAQAAHPVRYWIAEVALNKIQDIVMWPRDVVVNIRGYWFNRWINRSHSLTAHPRDIKPGNWCDLSDRLLYCSFNELVNFVECEQAWMEVVFSETKRAQYRVPWWRRWRQWRSAEAGLAHLAWASNLRENDDDPSSPLSDQAKAAIEIRELYDWWTRTRPNRLDPWEDHVFNTDVRDTRPFDIEAEYAREDDAMLIRLIKIRHHLWT